MTDYTARQDEDTADYAARVATLVSPAVRADAEHAYRGNLTDAVPLMILLTMMEKVAALAETEGLTVPLSEVDRFEHVLLTIAASEIDVYSLIYETATGPTVVVNNDQMSYADGHVSVGVYAPGEWLNLGDAIEEVREFSDLDEAAAAAYSLISAHS